MSTPRRRNWPKLRQVVDYAVIVGLYPSEDPTFGIELQRKNAGSAVWNTIYQTDEVGTQSEIRFVDRIPNDNRERSYRARQVKEGWTDGAWTDTVAGIPAELPTGDLPDLSGRGFGVDIWLDNKTLKVGTAASAGSLSKALVIPHSNFIPQSENASWHHGAAFSMCGTAGTQADFHAPVILPPGVTLSDFSLYGYLENSTDRVRVILQRSSGSNTVTGMGTVTQATTGWASTSSTAISHTMSSAFQYDLTLSLNGYVTSTHACLSHVNINYTMPSYDKTM